MDSTGNPLSQINDFELHDFFDGPDFDQFLDLIRGDQNNPITGFGMEFGYDHINSSFADQNRFGNMGTCRPAFDQHQIDNIGTCEPAFDQNLFDDVGKCKPAFDQNRFNEVGTCNPAFEPGPVSNGTDSAPSFDEDYMDGEDSSAATTRKGKVDRSRTLISERRRRGRMKEKLYALRSLVPNITKMDKASIVGDATLYVQELQKEVKKLKAEIADLEASNSDQTTQKNRISCSRNLPVCKKITQMDVFQVEEKGFYVRVVCSKGQGAAASLYKAIESLTSFHVRNSHLTTASDKLLLTFTFNGVDFGQSLNLPNLKLWIAGALLNQGFEFVTPLIS